MGTKRHIQKDTFLMTEKIRSGTVIYDGSNIGNNLQTGHNAVIREDNIIGNNVVVGVNSYLGPGNQIGNNVTIHTNCFLEGVQIGNNVFIGPHVVFTNDPNPPCKECTNAVGGAIVEDEVSIGANVTILPGITIHKGAMIGAGSVVTRDVTSYTVYAGNPAKKLKESSELKHYHE